jgi:CIC family chloride channel protein
MAENAIEQSSTTEGLPIAPSLGPAMQAAAVSTRPTPIDIRVVFICGLCIVIGAVAGYAAQALIHLIYFFTNLSFFGRFSFQLALAKDNHLGIWVILIPVSGALVIGLMLRYGSRAIAGHGIPEAIEQVLTNQSRIPAKMTFLKPLSAAISIGTGGPFGAEGPIIATGGAMGSLVGQLLKTTASERKTLLAAGAAAGIAAAFGSPVAAVLLAIELLLFEFRPRSIIPVALASAVAAGLHTHFAGPDPAFPFTGPALQPAGEFALLIYTLLGAVVGIGAVVMTRTVYWIEHHFEKLSPKIHWMWHPALGALAVGIIGFFSPRTLGPGYFNLDYLLSDKVLLTTAVTLGILKFLSWTIALGSGTAGGTLAPVFTIGGSLGFLIGTAFIKFFPSANVDLRVAALVGMVAIFAGASRALLTSVVFAFEITLQPFSLLPALCGCSAAYLVSSMLMQHSIMSEKMARQGVRVPAEYSADSLEQILVGDVARKNVITLSGDRSVGWAREWINSGKSGSKHQGYPLLNDAGNIIGVLTRRDMLDPAYKPEQKLIELIRRYPSFVYHDSTLRDAADQMARHNIGRLPVIDRADGHKVIGIVTRADLLFAYGRRLEESDLASASIRLWKRNKAQNIPRN